jgi:2-methylcitrate dehydratase PrpD
MMPTATEKYASFAVNLNYDKLPADVKNQVKKLIFDTVGCAVGGADAPWSKITTRFAMEQGGNPESTIICESKRAPAHYAMMANGAMVHAQDYDDIHHCSALHCAGVLAPAAIATAEKLGNSGKEVIAAFAAGYEVQHRIGIGLVPKLHYAKGFHPTCTTGSFGAATTIGKLYNLDEEKFVNALGIAGSTSCGIMEFLEDGTMTKRFHSGLAAYNGSISVKLAALGYTGPKTILEGKSGFLQAFTTEPQFGELDKDLGKVFEVMNTQIKLYACNGAFQTSIDVLLRLMKEQNFGPDDVEEITAGVASTASFAFNPYEPHTLLDAQMSLPFSLAVAAFKKKAGVKEFTTETISREDVKRFAKKVKIVIDPDTAREHIEDCRKLGVNLTVKTKDGKSYNRKLAFPADGPENWAPEEVEAKFTDLVSPVIGESKTTKLLGLLKKLETVRDITEITDLLRP